MSSQHSTTAARRGAAATAASSRAAAPKPPPCSIHPSAIISEKAVITGTHMVTIGEGSVVHPYAKISSAVGPVQIGKNCILAEGSTVGLVNGAHAREGTPVVLEDNTSIGTGAIVEAMRVGVCSTVGVSARLGPRANVGQFCKVSPFCIVADDLPDYTVVFGEGSKRIDATVRSRSDVRDLKVKGHLLHIDTLKRLIKSDTAKWIS